jgi:glycosyltransferase involved in cell wall biosynthesis
MDLAHRTNRGQDIKVIPNGTDTQRFSKSERGALGQLRIVFTSRLIGRKGLTFLLQGIEMLGTRLQDVHVTVAGDGDMSEQLRDEAKQRGLAEHVTFLGAVHPDQMPEIYRNADVFVLPSLNEGMSNSLLEAMTAGLAVITTSTGGARDLVNGNGVIIPRRNAKTIADALLQYLNHRDLLERHCNRSREIAEHLSWKNIARQYLALYDEVIAKNANTHSV